MGLVIFLALPLVIYLSLALVAPGRPAAIAIAVALALVGVTYSVQPQLAIVIFLAFGGIGMAVLAQSVRHFAGPRLAHSLYLKLLGVPPLVAVVILLLSRGA